MTNIDLEQIYKSMLDEKLLLIAKDRNSLSNEAQEILANEIDKRNLEIPAAAVEKAPAINSIDFINKTTDELFDEEYKDSKELFYTNQKLKKNKALFFFVSGALLIITGILSSISMFLGVGVVFIFK